MIYMSIYVIINLENVGLHWYGLGWQSGHVKHQLELLLLISIPYVVLHASNCKSCSEVENGTISLSCPFWTKILTEYC